MEGVYKKHLKDGSVRYMSVWREPGGKQKTKRFRRKKDAARYRAKMIGDVHDGTYSPVRKVPMDEVFDRWLSHSLEVREMTGELKPSTVGSYKWLLERHLRPAFGRYRSDRLTAKVVGDWRREMAERIASSTLAPKTFNNALNLFSSVIAWARHPAQSFLAQDPLVGQKRMTVPKEESKFLEDADIARLLGAVAESPSENAVIHVGLFAGLRRGEIFALRWEDVEWDSHRLHVRRAWSAGVLTTPKTTSSTRFVDVPMRLLDALRRHREAHPGAATDLMFRSPTGGPVNLDNWHKRTFGALRARAKLGAGVGLHSLRHSYASLLIRSNENLKYVSAQLGHSSIQITCDTYGHVYQATSTEAMGRLDALVPPAPRTLRVVRERLC